MTENGKNCCAENKGATNFKEFFEILLKSKINGLIPLVGSVLLLLFLFIHKYILWLSWIKYGTLVFIFAFMFMIAERFFAFKPKYIQLLNMILIIAFSVLIIIGCIDIWTSKSYYGYTYGGPGFDTVLYTIFLLIFTFSVNLYWCWDLIIPKMLAKKEKKHAEAKKIEVEMVDDDEPGKTPEPETEEPKPSDEDEN